MGKHNLLVINPGSTSTKIAIFENGQALHRKDLSHDMAELDEFEKMTDQAPFRAKEVEKFLQEIGYDISRLTAIAARGGSLPPIHMGAYLVNEEMLDVLYNRPIGEHASSLAAIIGYDIAKRLGINAYIYDGNTADEMIDVARISGHPLVKRTSMGHFLNTKAVGRMYAESINRRYEDLTLILIHMGGGISIALHENGRIVDVLTDECGTFSPERAGGLPSIGWARVCYSEKYTLEEASAMIRGKGGMAAYLGTNNAKKAIEDALAGDAKSKLIVDAMVYQTVKGIGSLAATVSGKVNGIVFTGGLAYSKWLLEEIQKKVSFLAPCASYPGEFEMEALAAGVARVLDGAEEARPYREHEEVVRS